MQTKQLCLRQKVQKMKTLAQGFTTYNELLKCLKQQLDELPKIGHKREKHRLRLKIKEWTYKREELLEMAFVLNAQALSEISDILQGDIQCSELERVCDKPELELPKLSDYEKEIERRKKLHERTR